MPCGVHRLVPCVASLHVVGWTAPDGAAHVLCRGYLGLYPHIESPSALYLLSNAILNKSKQFDVKPTSLTGNPGSESGCRPV